MWRIAAVRTNTELSCRWATIDLLPSQSLVALDYPPKLGKLLTELWRKAASPIQGEGKQLSIARLFVALLLCCAVPYAVAGLPFLSETVSWDEDVLLKGGQLLTVQRKATYGPDEFGRSGRGRLKEQTIRFSHNGQKIKWKNDDKWPIAYMPDILDFVNGIPVLVMPVHRWGPCNKHGFPQEGFVVFGYRNGDWSRIPITDLPKDLKVNLLRSTHAIRYWKEYSDKRITPSDKVKLEDGAGAAKPGQTISEASKFYAAYEESCARIRPLPNPLLDTAIERNMAAEKNARTLNAQLLQSSNSPEIISADDFLRAKGEWTGSGYLGSSCKGIVEGIGSLRQHLDGGAWRMVGYKLVLKDGSDIPIQQPDIKSAQAPASMEAVICNHNNIYSVKRQSKDQLVVHRFLQSGSLTDALRINLPDMSKFIPEGKWPVVWEALVVNDQLNITLGVYSYPSTANLGGVLEQRVGYAIRLPK